VKALVEFVWLAIALLVGLMVLLGLLMVLVGAFS